MSNTNYELGYYCDKITDKFFIFTLFTNSELPEIARKKINRYLKRVFRKDGITCMVNFTPRINRIQDVRVVNPEQSIRTFYTPKDMSEQERAAFIEKQRNF